MKKYLYITFFILLLSIPLSANPPIEKIIGQLLMIGFDGKTPADTRHILKAINEDRLGGVLLLGKNIESPEQLNTLTKSLQSQSKATIFIAVDQEGGAVARLNEKNGFEDFPSAKTVAKDMSLKKANELYMRMAHTLKAYGINYNLAPVVDVENINSPIIGLKKRSFSSFVATISLYSQAFIDAFKEVGVLTCLKHFPGHGSAVKDSHKTLTDISLTWDFDELRPYFDMIQTKKAQSIMMGHLYLKRFDLKYPASLSSSIVNGVLRTNMAYDGMVISDDLMMEGVSKEFDLKERIILSLKAGVDMLIISSEYLDDNFVVDRFYTIINEALESGELDEKMLREAYSRVIALKKELL